MNTIVSADSVRDIAGPLVYVDRCCSGADEACLCPNERIGLRYKCQEFLRRSISDRRSLSVVKNRAVNRNPLSLSSAFVAKEEESSVLLYGATNATAKLVAL